MPPAERCWDLGAGLMLGVALNYLPPTEHCWDLGAKLVIGVANGYVVWLCFEFVSGSYLGPGWFQKKTIVCPHLELSKIDTEELSLV